MNVHSKFGLLRIGDDVSTFFKVLNALLHSSVQTTISEFFFLMRLVNGTAMEAKSLIKRLQYPASPKNDQTFLFLALGISP